MKHLVAVLALSVPVLAIAGVVQAAEKAATVVVPLDDKPFKVGEKDTVRLTGKGIAGSRIEADVEGPAKVTATQSVSERKNGNALLGSDVKEFLIKPSGKGKVKVTVTVKPPQPDAKPKVTEYEFEVE
jgi:hypothetical protein